MKPKEVEEVEEVQMPLDRRELAPLPMYRLQSVGRHACGFESAREIDENTIELKFKAPWIGGHLVTLHDRRYNCWPVGVTVTRENDVVRVQTEPIDYAVVEVDGNRLVYPIQYVSVSIHEGGAEQSTVIRVDPQFLKINQPIPPSRFRLTPWPSETVYDRDTREVTPAADPAWVEAGKVDFPFDVFADYYQRGVEKNAAAGVPTRERGATGLEIAAAADSTPPPYRGWPWVSIVTWALVVAGVGVLIGAVVARRRGWQAGSGVAHN